MASSLSDIISRSGLSPSTTSLPLILLAVLPVLYLLIQLLQTIHYAFFGPLAKYPGPLLRRFTVLPKAYSIYSGNEGVDYVELHARYGPIVRIAPRELSYVGSAQAFRDIYGFKKTTAQNLQKDPAMVLKPMTGVHSILTADDANHARQRRILTPAFADRALKDLEPMLLQWVGKLVEKLGEKAASGEKADLLKYYNCTTFDVMADLCFNESLHMLENSTYAPWVRAIFGGVRAVTPFRAIRCISVGLRWVIDDIILKSPGARKMSLQHLKFSSDRVDKRLTQDPPRADLWTKILAHNADGEKNDKAFSLGEHRATAMLFMGAGTETSATALSGITYHLLCNPASLARLTAEIRGVAASTDVQALGGLDALRRLPYLQAVVNEGLRMYPPVPIGLARRTPAAGTTICGEWIPGDVTVGVHQLATYRSEENFHRAGEWHPERWLVGTEDAAEFRADRLDTMEPFSVGPRNCIGKNLALHEIRLILAATLLNFDLSLCGESQGWTDQKVYLLWEKRPLWCTLAPVGKI